MRGNAKWLALGLASLVVGIYYSATAVWFMRDDFLWLAPLVGHQRDGDRVAIQSVFISGGHHFKPVGILLRQALFALFGLRAGHWHLTGILLHTLNALLVFSLSRAFALSSTFSFFASVSFAVAVGHAETVVWLSTGTYLLSAVFFIFSILAYRHYATEANSSWGIAALSGQWLAMLSGTHGVQLPLVFLFLQSKEASPFRISLAHRRILAASFLSSIAYFILYRYFKRDALPEIRSLGFDLWQGGTMVLAAPVHSVLTFFCSKAPGISATALAPAGLLTAILCGVGLKRLCPDRHGHLRSAALFLVIAWLAYLPFFAGRSVFQNAYLWERAHYIPNAMLAVALTLVGAAFFRGQSRALAAVLAGVVLSANAWRTAEKVNRIRLDSEKFRTDTVALCRALETEAHQKGIIYRPDGEYRTAETRLSGTWVRLSQSAVVYCGWHRCGGDCAESGDGVVKVFKKEPPLGPKSLSAPHEEETKPVAMGKH